MTAYVIESYTSAASQIPDEALLGNIIWYTISQADVDYEQARKELESRGLDARLLRPIRPIDAFKLAASELKHSFKVEDDVKLNVLIRSAGQDGETSHRHVILERVTAKKGKRRRIIYDYSAEMVYTRGTKKNGEYSGDSIEITRRSVPGLVLTAEQQEWLDKGLDGLTARYNHLKSHLQSHKVRNFVREYLYSLDAISIKEGGGVYFTFQDHKDELRLLQEWVQSIGSECSVTPLLDLMDKRQEIARAFEDEAIAEIERLSKEIGQILSNPGRTIREETFDEFGQRAAELTSKANNYRDMLGVKGDLAKMQIDQFKRQVLDLTDRIDYGKARK